MGVALSAIYALQVYSLTYSRGDILTTISSVQPHDYAMDLQAMTKEKLQFSLPVVFTVGPDVNQRGANTSGPEPIEDGVSDGAHDEIHNIRREDRGDALMKYAMLLADSGTGSKNAEQHAHVGSIVKGIIEGETRVLVSSMTMEEIFTEREVFKKRIFRNIQGELDQFGLKIYNANVCRPFLQVTPFLITNMKFRAG